MLIFINDIQFGCSDSKVGIVFPRLIEKLIIDIELKHISGFQTGIPVNALAVAFDALDADVFLRQRGRKQGDRLGQKTVQALAGIIGADGEFFHLLLPILFSKWRLVCSMNSRAGL